MQDLFVANVSNDTHFFKDVYVRSAMLYGNETWRLRENEMTILRRTKRAMVRAVCGAKLMDKKRTEDLILGLKETVVQMANGVRWYGHVLRRDDRRVLRKVLEFDMKGQRKCWFGLMMTGFVPPHIDYLYYCF